MSGDRVAPPTYVTGAGTGSGLTEHDMSGRVCVVTGANRGIGRATAQALARLGGHVVLVCRDAARGREAQDAIRRETGSEQVDLMVADLALLRSVANAAAALSDAYPAIHLLVNNAGVHAARRRVTDEGMETTLAVNHLAAFTLTTRLLPNLEAGAPSRVVNVTSEFERIGRIRFGDVQMAHRYSGVGAYVQSKLANVLFTYELAGRLTAKRSGVTVNCVYPGLVATDLMRERWWWRTPWLRPIWTRMFMSPEAAARAVVRVATVPELAGVTGECFDARGRPVRTSRQSYDVASGRRLWEVTDQIVRQALDKSLAEH